MAHAGTPTDLAKQPATSTTNGLWQAFLAAIVILAIGAGAVLLSANVAGTKGAPAPAVDHRMDQIEGQRGAISMAAPRADRRFDELIVAAAADGSYSKVESSRGGALSATGGTTKLGGTPVNTFDKLPGHRDAQVSQ